MPVSPDLSSYDFALPQSTLQPTPTTLASAATMAPTTLVTLVTGAAAIVNITPPQAGIHMLIFISSGGTYTMTAAGNILTAVAASAAGVMTILIYNPVTGKYAAGKLAL